MGIIILLSIYIVPLLVCRNYIIKKHKNPKGENYGEPIELVDVVFMLIPLLNLAFLLNCLFISWKDDEYINENKWSDSWLFKSKYDKED
jgi:hypothetical protein